MYNNGEWVWPWMGGRGAGKMFTHPMHLEGRKSLQQ